MICAFFCKLFGISLFDLETYFFEIGIIDFEKYLFLK